MFSFIDGYSGYNQDRMTAKDAKKKKKTIKTKIIIIIKTTTTTTFRTLIENFTI